MTLSKKGEFVELEYTGRIKSDKRLFDTTDKDIAKKEHLHNPKVEYGPVVACIGQKHVLKGLDDNLDGKELGKEYSLDLEMDKAFGKKDAKLIRTVPATLFRKQKMNPVPGLQINADGMIGTIRSVNGGRVLVDFNHPLAGKDLEYKFKILKVVKNTEKQLESLLRYGVALNKKMYDYTLTEEKLEMKLKFKLPKELQNKISEKIKEIIPKIKKIEFSEEITTQE